MVKIIDPTTDRRWDANLLNKVGSSVYHSSAWKEVIDKTFRQVKPFYIVWENKKGEIESGVAAFYIRSMLTGKRIVSLPFSSFCDPIMKNPEQAEKLIEAIVSKVKDLNLDYIEFRMLKFQHILKSIGFVFSEHNVTHILPLNTSKDKLFQSFHRTSVRQNIKRAERSGLRLFHGQNLEDIKKFFRLHLLTRKKIGLPSQPNRYFENMFSILYPKNALALLLAEYSGTIIAATILLKDEKTVYSEYAASDPEYLRLRPNHWIFWKAIEYAKDHGYEYFDFGLTSKYNKGLIDFKRSWGAMQHPIYYAYYLKKPML